jgi:transcriptional regulator with XRE-family HTH domain
MVTKAKPKLAQLARGKTVTPVVQDAVVEEGDGRGNPVHRFVAQLREKDGINYLTTAEVAKTLGVSTNWVRKIQRQKMFGVPSLATQLGQITVYLYTPEDVDKVRRYLADRQTVFTNPAQGRADSWEDVVSRRERTPQDEDRP